MPDLPIMLKVAGRRCVIVGGGSVALRRARAMLACGADVTVIAPKITRELDELAFANRGLTVHCRPYRPDDLNNALIVVIATNNEAVNDQVTFDASATGILINRTDESEAGDVAIMAHDRRGPITLAVHSGGVSAAASVAIRDELLSQLDEAWITLLNEAATYRQRIQSMIPDAGQRQSVLRQLGSREALDALKSGGVEQLRDYYQSLLDAYDASPQPDAPTQNTTPEP